MRPLEVQKQFSRSVHWGWYVGLRFAKNAPNASFASSDLTLSANTWFSNFTGYSHRPPLSIRPSGGPRTKDQQSSKSEWYKNGD